MKVSNRYLHVISRISLAAIAAASGLAHAERIHRYAVSVNPELTRLAVTACFDGQVPDRLVAESLDASVALIGVWNDKTGKEIQPSGSIPLKTLAADGCVRYAVDVSRPIKRHDRTGGKVRRVGSDVAVSVGLWLWRPERLDQDEDVELVFELPESIGMSVPWSPVDGTDQPTYRLGRTPSDWPAWSAFGHFTERTAEVAGSQLRIALLDGSPAVDRDEIGGWVIDAAVMVGGLYGRFPYPNAQVLVVPNARVREPTPWAFVTRGGGPAVHFVINQRRPINEFYEDWTAAHEFSHLLLPFVRSREAWVSEGLATYYQNVLRARAGRLSEQTVWQNLHAGFGRGRREAQDLTLSEATRRMYHSRLFMKVYWSGTAIMLLADVRLRQYSDGAQSLDTALAALNSCCFEPQREWRARELFAKLDELTGTDVFTQLLNEYEDSEQFPDLSTAYRELGLEPYGRRSVRLASDAPYADLRRAIMSGNGAGAGTIQAPSATLDR
ncbi:MAG: hypothetical protein JSW48_03680 [Betaproteobacteria bacterium]|jgi:hypothetical protein|nr:MAG: hypothetical protein JSW48_03680 [Betaproteobacteria bacterium]